MATVVDMLTQGGLQIVDRQDLGEKPMILVRGNRDQLTSLGSLVTRIVPIQKAKAMHE